MGIGIPKVRLILPDENEIRWVEIEEFLSYDSVLFVFGVISITATNKLVKLLLFLEHEDEDEEIYLYIHSPGGGAHAAITIYDTMNMIKPDVCTLVMGSAASAASLVLTGGATGRRVAFPHARVMIHQPMTSRFSGLPSLLVSEAEEMLDLRNTIANIYAKTTRKPLSVIQQDLERDTFMSAKEAQAYGIIDHISKDEEGKKAVTKGGDSKEENYKAGLF